MGLRTLTRDAYTNVKSSATLGGTKSATHAAEERVHRGEGLDPLVDPKGPPHLGPVRMSLPRYEKVGNLWRLTVGIPMAVEKLLDTTGSMDNNVNLAFENCQKEYDLYRAGAVPVLHRYDVQMATGAFGDVEDFTRLGLPFYCRSQFEMDEKIAVQMSLMVAAKKGWGNGKEDPQFGLFGAAYLTQARINAYGLKSYHFTVSDEPVVPVINYDWLKHVFGDDVLTHCARIGYQMSANKLPDTAQVVKDLQTRAHAFFLLVDNSHYVIEQWKALYGSDHFVFLPNGTTEYIHFVNACIIGLTEGVLDLQTAREFLLEHKLSRPEADSVVRAVAHIPLGAQAQYPNFDNLPKAGDLFREKTDLWPVEPSEVENSEATDETADGEKPGGPVWL
ncbi:TPA: hypothetical protein DF272_02870 [Candidatus Falkowbacteria bacterium]|nr:hypothetical protein [Candidatus Falkowbacteria bacterium]